MNTFEVLFFGPCRDITGLPRNDFVIEDPTVASLVNGK